MQDICFQIEKKQSVERQDAQGVEQTPCGLYRRLLKEQGEIATLARMSVEYGRDAPEVKLLALIQAILRRAGEAPREDLWLMSLAEAAAPALLSFGPKERRRLQLCEVALAILLRPLKERSS